MFDSAPKVVDIDTTRHLSREHAQDDFECDVRATNAVIARFEAGCRRIDGAGLARFPARLVVTQPALTGTGLHARHRFIRIRQVTQHRIHAIGAQFDMADGTERLQFDVRPARVRQLFCRCASELGAVRGPVRRFTRS